MAAYYELRRTPDPKQTGEEQPLYPKFVPLGTISMTELCQRAAEESTFGEYELKGALDLLTKYTLKYLSEGKNVELGEFGTLSISLKGRPVMNAEEIRSTSIKVSDLVLRTSKEMKSHLSRIVLERNPWAWSSAPLDIEKRNRLLEEHFKKKLFITRSEYQELRGCKRMTAIRELNQLIDEGRIERYGRCNQGLYTLCKPSSEGEGVSERG